MLVFSVSVKLGFGVCLQSAVSNSGAYPSLKITFVTTDKLFIFSTSTRYSTTGCAWYQNQYPYPYEENAIVTNEFELR